MAKKVCAGVIELSKVLIRGRQEGQGQRRRDDLAVAKSLQSCPILCDPIDGPPPGSLFPGILQARALEWVLHKH